MLESAIKCLTDRELEMELRKAHATFRKSELHGLRISLSYSSKLIKRLEKEKMERAAQC
jgi:hypothetical protein